MFQTLYTPLNATQNADSIAKHYQHGLQFSEQGLKTYKHHDGSASVLSAHRSLRADAASQKLRYDVTWGLDIGGHG